MPRDQGRGLRTDRAAMAVQGHHDDYFCPEALAARRRIKAEEDRAEVCDDPYVDRVKHLEVDWAAMEMRQVTT